MRKVFSVALMAAMLCLVGMTKDAGATLTIALQWGACGGGTCSPLGTDTITVAGAGQTLRLDVFLTHDLTQGMESHTFSLNFDTDFLNELNLGPMVVAEWSGTDVDPAPATVVTYAPFTTGSTVMDSSGAVAGRVNSYESGSLLGVLPASGAAYSVGTFTATAPASYRVAQAFFTTTGTVGSDGADIFSGLFNGLFDVLIDGNSVVLLPGTVTFGTATVNIPEPGTVSLLGLGLVGLVLAGRRSRRS